MNSSPEPRAESADRKEPSPIERGSDDKLFDRSQFQADLALKDSPIGAFKKVIRKARQELDRRFRKGADISALVEQRAWFTDQILRVAWGRFSWGQGTGIALLAVGGYGRGELLPHSDIDLLILLENGDNECFRGSIEGFLTLLWDIGLPASHSVRSLQECAAKAANDLTIISNLMESRTLSGDQRLRQKMQSLTDTSHMWPSRAFYLAKRVEQSERHAKYNDTEYNLEPNVKGSPGGLRDLQTLLWIARRQFGSVDLQVLVREGFLSESELTQMTSARNFLWRVRYALHLLAGRDENRLLFNYQKEVAVLLGFRGEDATRTIEHFMQKYYRVVMRVTEVNELVNQHFEEVILHAGAQGPAQPLNSRFQLREDYIEAVNDQVFRRFPFALMEIFLLVARHPKVRGIRADTIRLIRDHLYLVDEDFRNDQRVAGLFIELFKSPQHIYESLQRMNRYGILGRYLPEFGYVTGQMQHDLFHIYTVDAHTLNLVRHLSNLRRGLYAEKFPLASDIMRRLAKPELLYLAGLYHDIGKGRGGDHSEIGATLAQAFCARHQLAEEDSQLIVWLVRNHLALSTTAQNKDIFDPAVIMDFAHLVGDVDRLDYLDVLTVADIYATNPSLWNSWRASLVRQLYKSTKRALARGLENPLQRDEKVRQAQAAALRLLGPDIHPDQAEQLWGQLGDDYFLRHSGADIAWHTQAILQHRPDQGPLVMIRKTSQADVEGASQIFIYAPDQHDFFAVTVAAMSQLNLSIQAARIITSTSQFTLDTYIVLDADQRPLDETPGRSEEIRQSLINALKNPDDYSTIIQRRVPRQLQHFAFAPQVTLYNDPQRQLSVLQLVAPDRPGLLAKIGGIFLDFGISLQNANITTLGERVEDIFLLTDADNQPLANPDLCRQLQQTLVDQLSEDHGGLPWQVSI